MVIFRSYVSLPEGIYYGGFHKWRYPNSWMVDFMDYPRKMDDLGLPPFQESTICHAFRQRKVTNGMDLGVKAYPEMTSP